MSKSWHMGNIEKSDPTWLIQIKALWEEGYGIRLRFTHAVYYANIRKEFGSCHFITHFLLLEVVSYFISNNFADLTQIYGQKIGNIVEDKTVSALLPLMNQPTLDEQASLIIDSYISFGTTYSLCEWLYI